MKCFELDQDKPVAISGSILYDTGSSDNLKIGIPHSMSTDTMKTKKVKYGSDIDGIDAFVNPETNTLYVQQSQNNPMLKLLKTVNVNEIRGLSSNLCDSPNTSFLSNNNFSTIFFQKQDETNSICFSKNMSKQSKKPEHAYKMTEPMDCETYQPAIESNGKTILFDSGADKLYCGDRAAASGFDVVVGYEKLKDMNVLIDYDTKIIHTSKKIEDVAAECLFP